MKKIVFLHPAYWEQAMGGAELQIKYAMKYALNDEFKVYNIFENNGIHVNNYKKICLFPLKKPLLNKLFGQVFVLHYFEIMKILKEIKPDIIYTRYHCSWSGFAAYYAKKNNVKHIWAIASDKDVVKKKYIIKTKNLFYVFEAFWSNFAYKNATKIICQNEYQKNILFKEHERESLLIQQMTSFVPEHLIQKSSDVIRLVWVANFKKIKRPEMFIQLIAHLNVKRECKFTMIGKNNKQFTNLIQSVTDKRFEYIGEVTNDIVNDILMNSHILINTSEYEGFSNTFVEAWMRKVPVLSMNSNPNNIISDYNLGYICPTLEKLVQKVSFLIENDNQRIEMGNRAYYYAKYNHNININMPKVFSYFND